MQVLQLLQALLSVLFYKKRLFPAQYIGVPEGSVVLEPSVKVSTVGQCRDLCFHPFVAPHRVEGQLGRKGLVKADKVMPLATENVSFRQVVPPCLLVLLLELRSNSAQPCCALGYPNQSEAFRWCSWAPRTPRAPRAAQGAISWVPRLVECRRGTGCRRTRPMASNVIDEVRRARGRVCRGAQAPVQPQLHLAHLQRQRPTPWVLV
mmetsp:Transcript_121713/g.306218  ORF Transcript_121713/g.306218 Transcript_121713/m.306218 type:complete len:206 (+) Transcript_121713:374-991(+)